MSAAEECAAKSRDMSEKAAMSAMSSPEFLTLAEEWLRLAETAEGQGAIEADDPRRPQD